MQTKQSKKNNSESSLWNGAVAGLVAGIIGSWVKLLVEPLLQRLGENLFPPAPGEKQLCGADIIGRPLNMPPAALIRETAKKTTGQTPDRTTTNIGMMGIHYAFGTSLAVSYCLLAEEIPAITAGAGLPAGAAMWAATHGSIVPAIGIQAPVGEMPAAWYVWELGSHIVFGLTVEVVRRAVRSRL